MAKDFAKSFYKSRKWQRCRDSYIAILTQKNGGLCERCGQVPGHIIHHKTHLTADNIKDPDVTLNHCNLQYVCLECHNKIHEEEVLGRKKRASMLINGRLIPFENDDGDRFQIKN